MSQTQLAGLGRLLAMCLTAPTSDVGGVRGKVQRHCWRKELGDLLPLEECRLSRQWQVAGERRVYWMNPFEMRPKPGQWAGRRGDAEAQGSLRFGGVMQSSRSGLPPVIGIIWPRWPMGSCRGVGGAAGGGLSRGRRAEVEARLLIVSRTWSRLGLTGSWLAAMVMQAGGQACDRVRAAVLRRCGHRTRVEREDAAQAQAEFQDGGEMSGCRRMSE